jgi:hypothetical protein
VDQLSNPLAQRERGTGDKHAQGRDQRPEVDLPSVPQGVYVIVWVAAAALSDVEDKVFGAVGE